MADYYNIAIQGMSSLRLLIPFRLSHGTPANSLKHQLMHELNNYSPDPPWIQCCDRSHCGSARPARSPNASAYAHAQLSALTGHVTLSIS